MNCITQATYDAIDEYFEIDVKKSSLLEKLIDNSRRKYIITEQLIVLESTEENEPKVLSDLFGTNGTTMTRMISTYQGTILNSISYVNI